MLRVTFLVCLLLCSFCFADVYKVIPDGSGTHTTIQAAINDAMAGGGFNEIRVATGHWNERPVIDHALGAGQLFLTGGWSHDFLMRSHDESQTVLDGTGKAPVIRIETDNGRVFVTGFTITGGNSPTPNSHGTLVGGGIYIESGGSAEIRIEDNELSGNHYAPALNIPADGAGITVILFDEAEVHISENTITDNSAMAFEEETATGGGMSLDLFGNSQTFIQKNVISANRLEAPANQATGSAIYLYTYENAYVAIWDNKEIRDNLSVALWTVAAVGLYARDSSVIDVRRNDIRANFGNEDSFDQVEVNAGGSARITFTDSLIALGSNTGITASAIGSGSVFVTNLTVASNTGVGVAAGTDEMGTIFLSNNLVFGNGYDPLVAAGSIVETANLYGVDPHFVNVATGDYHLEAGSPAIDRGSNSPPGGISDVDLDFQRRLQGPRVDIGCFETSAASPGRAAQCRVLSDIHPAGIDRTTHACRCLTDDSLRVNRCSFLLPDLFLVALIPMDLKPADAFKPEWTIQSWDPAVNSSYEMSAEARIGDKWKPQVWFGPSADNLKFGVLINEVFEVKTDQQGATPLRTTITYNNAEDTKITEILEILLPEVVISSAK